MMNTSVRIPLLRLPHSKTLPLPTYMTPGSAGMDVCAAQSCTLSVGKRALLPAGFCLAIPEGYEGQIRPRSGLAWHHGLTVLNAPGTIDSDYRQEICVLLVNFGDAPFEVTLGLRIAQLVIAPVAKVRFTLDAFPQHKNAVRSGGFGSTGQTQEGADARANVMTFSRKTQAALEAVVEIALHARPHPVQVKKITARHNLSHRALESTMQQLVRAGILKGQRGPHGGYRLAKERRRITVGDIVRTLNPKKNICEEGDPNIPARHIVVSFWKTIQKDFFARLDATTLEDLSGAQKTQKTHDTDFTI